jgi:peptidoglycan/LPS O-acetylase OafA/YrhL
MAINFAPYANRDYLMYLQKAPISYPFRAALIYVETFLVFSGFLLSYSITGRLQKGIRIDYFKEIAGRYLRIVPTMIVVIAITTWILPLVDSGPYFVVNTDEGQLCRSYWWRNIFLIHNLFGISDICLPQTHHIATDFALFSVTIFLVLYTFKNPLKGYSLIAFLSVASMIARFYTVYANNLVVYLSNGT